MLNLAQFMWQLENFFAATVPIVVVWIGLIVVLVEPDIASHWMNQAISGGQGLRAVAGFVLLLAAISSLFSVAITIAFGGRNFGLRNVYADALKLEVCRRMNVEPSGRVSIHAAVGQYA